MFPIITPQILNLVEGAQAGPLLRLPWPNGSLLPARLLPVETPGNARLQLSGFTLMAQIPPSTPMGTVWLQLIQRDMPARFRILSPSQAIEILADMLQKTENKTPTKTSSPTTQNNIPNHLLPASQPQLHEQGWSRLDTTALPWFATGAPEGNSVMLRDHNDGQDRGMVLRESHGDDFSFQGRLDLEHLGAVLFHLQGSMDAGSWNLAIHTSEKFILSELRTAIQAWTVTQEKQHPGLQSEVHAGLPEDTASRFSKVRA
ncbi:MAG: hypothetical protein Q9M24_02045 [Mariprofundaceae bacterium]|nr:hypothetical protein [Mariprofundaceae bacterium]